MAETMIERVARGMCRAAITKPAAAMYSPDGVEYHVNKRWPEYVDHARAAIETMREPTEAMLENGSAMDSLSGHPLDIWQAMVAAALTHP
jgi:hypothetical protein